MNLGGFESELQIEERRKLRQEEWEKVRTADQPEVAPEEKFDGRSLYDRLKEQRDAKDYENEESKKFKNMIRGLDDEDCDHLNDVDSRRIIEEKKQKEEELKELQDYRAKVAEFQEISHADQKLAVLTSKPKPSQSSRTTSQKVILSTVVKRKSQQQSSQEPSAKRRPTSGVVSRPASALKCLAILPGIGDYKSSDESDGSSDALEEANAKIDLQRLIRNKKEHCDE